MYKTEGKIVPGEVHVIFFNDSFNPPKKDNFEDGCVINKKGLITVQNGFGCIIVYDTGKYKHGAKFNEAYTFNVNKVIFTDKWFQRLDRGVLYSWPIVEVYGTDVKR